MFKTSLYKHFSTNIDKFSIAVPYPLLITLTGLSALWVLTRGSLVTNLVKFNNKTRPKNKEGKQKRRDSYESTYALYEGRKSTFNTFKSGTFSLKPSQGKRFKGLTPKQSSKDY